MNILVNKLSKNIYPYPGNAEYILLVNSHILEIKLLKLLIKYKKL